MRVLQTNHRSQVAEGKINQAQCRYTGMATGFRRVRNTFISFYCESEWEGDEAREELSDLLHGPEAVLSDHAVLPGGLWHLHVRRWGSQHFLFTGGLR